MRKKTKLVCGVGVNDADYPVTSAIGGKRVNCPFYQTWKDMLVRCYSKKKQEKHPTYIGCTVHTEWLVFSAFKAWMIKQDWQDNQLDKDLLIAGNKVYSPDTCVFVSKATNVFLNDRAAMRGDWPIGVHLDKEKGKFKSQCNNPFTKKYEYLGLFNCPDAAHLAWRKRKNQLALQLADIQTDDRVAAALIVRYTPA